LDIFFTDPSEIPLPPEEVRIRELRATIRSNRLQVHVYLEVDPFQQRPNADLDIIDASGRVVSSASIIESMVRKIEVNLHLRQSVPLGSYTVRATLFYVKMPEAGEETTDPQPIERIVVDTSSTTVLL